MTDLALPRPRQEDLSSVALLESTGSAELHLRGCAGTLLRLPLADADRQRGLAALATMVGALHRAAGNAT
ncbi:hypothetical protein [Neoroseomonas soli]|uniref:Uncharacterized protein n=1 Tax=Neoroseomonas soli TaxID=1081025 RepID=A0A9X9WS80_9PROT|nr:hypothetical protein [Neoroseomonas soli]MBR0670009.1 hypothetical protein [Neoroseomonas soli]